MYREGVVALTISSSSPMSRKHSSAAGLVIWARGSLDVPSAAATIIPFKPKSARKQAREAPAGPAPTIRNVVSIIVLISSVITAVTAVRSDR
ncbi:hypothetical protein FH972_022870 [Carpinus fangiana]|uniref:Uncharacterized protein n=1 Tax=Carpinus fangiana TaxID=176857 RepID=A0A5N6KVR4_9ROSI|nr:hypothetical protein FH972_022870 [Carpinus fangiana]